MNFVPLFSNASATVSDASVVFPANGFTISTPLGVVAAAPSVSVVPSIAAALPSFANTTPAVEKSTSFPKVIGAVVVEAPPSAIVMILVPNTIDNDRAPAKVLLASPVKFVFLVLPFLILILLLNKCLYLPVSYEMTLVDTSYNIRFKLKFQVI